MTKEYATVLHRWFDEVWNIGRAETIDELLDPNAIVYGLTESSDSGMQGADAFKTFYASFRGAFPDIRVEIQDSVTEGDKIVARCVVYATHSGDGLAVAASGKQVKFSGMCQVRVKDGRITEAWNSFDFLTMMQQIGAVHLPNP